MKGKNMKRAIIIIMMIMTTPLFALIGFGANINVDKVMYEGYTATEGSGDFSYSVTGEPFTNAAGLSLYLFLDFIPIVDLEANIELVGNSYKFITKMGETELANGEFPWGRISTYLTVRKKIVGVKIPFLAKAQIYAGGGINSHSVSPRLGVDFFTSAFNSNDISSSLSQDFNNTETFKIFTDYVEKKSTKHSGIHLQAGSQIKLLFLNMFINGRYTFAKDVIPDTNGFFSMNAGLAVGI
jgi:hypothetical protein